MPTETSETTMLTCNMAAKATDFYESDESGSISSVSTEKLSDDEEAEEVSLIAQL